MSTLPKSEQKHQHINAVQAAISGSAENNRFVRDLLSKEEFRDRLGLESTRMVDELIRKRKVPVIRLGHRTLKIPWSRALKALERLEIRAIGQ